MRKRTILIPRTKVFWVTLMNADPLPSESHLSRAPQVNERNCTRRLPASIVDKIHRTEPWEKQNLQSGFSSIFESFNACGVFMRLHVSWFTRADTVLWLPIKSGRGLIHQQHRSSWAIQDAILLKTWAEHSRPRSPFKIQWRPFILPWHNQDFMWGVDVDEHLFAPMSKH